MKRGWLALGLAMPLVVGASEPRLEDFAYGITLEAQSERPIQRLPVPDAVYREVTRADLGDIRVFDASGAMVPHSLQRADTFRTESEEVSVPFFPLPNLADSPEGRIEVETDGRGAIVRLREPQERTPRTVAAYLIDLSGVERSVASLRLHWRGAEQVGWLGAVDLEASPDLEQWHSLARGATLARLRFDERELIQDRIEFAATDYPYVRITWPADSAAVLTAVEAQAVSQRESRTRRWVTLEPESSPAAAEQHYSSTGYYPADRVSLVFEAANNLADVTIESQIDRRSPWRIRHRGLYYDLRVDGTTLVSPPAAIRAAADPSWRIRGSRVPVRLRLGWIPHELYFLAQGEGPYTLAFGSAGMPPAEQPVNSLFEALNADAADWVADAVVGQQRELGGPNRLTPVSSSWPWSRWLLWGVLILGVLVVGVLAVRLLRDQ